MLLRPPSLKLSFILLAILPDLVGKRSGFRGTLPLLDALSTEAADFVHQDPSTLLLAAESVCQVDPSSSKTRPPGPQSEAALSPESDGETGCDGGDRYDLGS